MRRLIVITALPLLVAACQGASSVPASTRPSLHATVAFRRFGARPESECKRVRCRSIWCGSPRPIPALFRTGYT